MDYQEAKPRVNGAMLSDFINRNVCLIGHLSEINPSGMQFKVKTSDDQIVTVNTSQASSEYLEGVVEVQGRVTSSSSISSDLINAFPDSKDFDMSSYNEAVILAAKYKE